MKLDRQRVRNAAAAWLVCALVACGGGGGGSSDSLSVQLDKSSIDLTYEQGQTVASARVTATLNGPLPTGTVYIGAETDGQGIGNVQLNFPSSRTAQVDISPDTTLAVGRYSGTLYVHACNDELCRSELTGSPYAVRYSVTVQPGLRVTPAVLSLQAVSGFEATQAVAVQLPASASDYVIDPDSVPDWLTIENRSASGFTVRSRSLPAGTRNVFLTLSTPGRSATLTISLAIDAPAGGERNLGVSPTALDLRAVEGTATATDIQVTAPTWHPSLSTDVSYAGAASGWLTVTPNPTGYTLRADAAGLPSGSYSATLRISGDADTAAQNVPVSLTVGPGLLGVSPRTITVGADTTAAELALRVPVTLIDGPQRSWAAQSSVPWLSVDTPTGLTGGNLDIHIDRAALSAQDNRSELSGQITVIPSGAVSPMSFQVTLAKRLPQVHFTGPGALPAHQPHTLIVSGSGFAAVADIGARLRIDGLSGYTASRVSDSELTVALPAAAAGTYTVSLNNALDLPNVPITFRVFDPGTVPATRIAQAGQKTALIHDVVHDSLLVLNRDLGAIQRHAYSGGTWQSSSVSFASLNGIGLSPDGNTLVATSSEGTLRLLDPVTLAVRNSYSHVQGLYVWAGVDGTLPVTNDGKVWLTSGDGNFGTLWTFDLITRQFAAAGTNGISTLFFGGPWGLVSGNGERLLLTQSAGVSPAPPLLYLDARDSLLRVSPLNPITDVGFFYRASFSESGNRLVLLDYLRVLDANFATVGQFTLPSGYAVASALTADGQTLFVLGNPSNFGVADAPPPTVWVFDARAVEPGGLNLPLLGHFDLTTSFTCVPDNVDNRCYERPHMRVAPDARTLFIAGPAAVMAVAVPDTIAVANASHAQPSSARKRGVPLRLRAWGGNPAR